MYMYVRSTIIAMKYMRQLITMAYNVLLPYTCTSGAYFLCAVSSLSFIKTCLCHEV